jgi:hypothetical protein
MKVFLLIAFTFLFINCKNRESSVVNNCKCYNSIGSNEKSIPNYLFLFKKNQSISLCGYLENDTISEFSVFDCSNGNSLIEYGATQNCKIEFNKNQLNIYELDTFPSGINWKWKTQRIALQKISQNKKRLIVHMQIPLELTHQISIKEQILFLDSFKTNKYKTIDTEELIGRLEILALTNNLKAKKILIELKNDSNIILDGAIKEQYNNAIAKINWMKI